MIVGEVRIIRWEESDENAFVISSASLNVTNPDATTVAPAVDVAPPGSDIDHILSATVDFAQGGAYRVVWSEAIGVETYLRPDLYFAAFSDIYLRVRELLGETETVLPDTYLDRVFSEFVRQIEGRYTCIGSYRALAWPDTGAIDEALAWMTAVRLFSGIDLIRRRAWRYREGDGEYYFATPTELALEQQSWLCNAARALGRIACISDSVRANAFSPFVTTGPSKFNAIQGSLAPLDQVLGRIVTDAIIPWRIGMTP